MLRKGKHAPFKHRRTTRRAPSRELKASSALAIPALIAATASPVILFYTVGYLLAFGYFLTPGPALMTIFSPTELALVGFARLSGTIATGVFLAFIAVSASYCLPRSTSRSRSHGSIKAKFFTGSIGFVATIMIVVESVGAGYLATLLAIVALIITLGMTVAFLRGKEDSLRRRDNPWRWALPAVLLLVGLPSIGEAGFREAVDNHRAQWIVVQSKPAKLIMLGAGAMIYELGERRYLSGPRGENPMPLGRQVMTLRPDAAH